MVNIASQVVNILLFLRNRVVVYIASGCISVYSLPDL